MVGSCQKVQLLRRPAKRAAGDAGPYKMGIVIPLYGEDAETEKGPVLLLGQRGNQAGNLGPWTPSLPLGLFRVHHHGGCFLWGPQGELTESWAQSPTPIPGLVLPLASSHGKSRVAPVAFCSPSVRKLKCRA